MSFCLDIFSPQVFILYTMLQTTVRVRLSDLCSIQMGYTARERLIPAVSDGIAAIQLRDISAEATIQFDALTRYTLADVPRRYLVGSGDVLFRSRGERNTATAIDEQLNEPAIAVLPIIILRPHRVVVDPEFLAWAINQHSAQRQLDSAARGTSMRMIPKASLDALELDIPDLATQRAIVATDRLAERERELVALAAEKRRKLIAITLSSYIDATPPSSGKNRKDR